MLSNFIFIILWWYPYFHLFFSSRIYQPVLIIDFQLIGSLSPLSSLCVASLAAKESSEGILWHSSSSFHYMFILRSLPNKYPAHEAPFPLPSGIQNCDESDKIPGKIGLTTEGVNFCSGWRLMTPHETWILIGHELCWQESCLWINEEKHKIVWGGEKC